MSAHIKDIGNNLSILDRYERDITNIKDDLTMHRYIWPFLMGSIIDNKNISSKYSHIWPISKRSHLYLNISDPYRIYLIHISAHVKPIANIS